MILFLSSFSTYIFVSLGDVITLWYWKWSCRVPQDQAKLIFFYKKRTSIQVLKKEFPPKLKIPSTPFPNNTNKCMLTASCLWKWEICKTWKQQNEIMWFDIFPFHFSAWKCKMPPPSAVTIYNWFPSVTKVVKYTREVPKFLMFTFWLVLHLLEFIYV